MTLPLAPELIWTMMLGLVIVMPEISAAGVRPARVKAPLNIKFVGIKFAGGGGTVVVVGVMVVPVVGKITPCVDGVVVVVVVEPVVVSVVVVVVGSTPPEEAATKSVSTVEVDVGMVSVDVLAPPSF